MRQDKLNPTLPKGIGLLHGQIRRISIPHDILRIRIRVHRPLLRRRIPSGEVIRVLIIDERSPRAAHEFGQIGVGGALVREGVDGAVLGVVAQAVDVVEDPGDFLEVGDADPVGQAGGLGVEAVGVGWDAVGRPGLGEKLSVSDGALRSSDARLCLPGKLRDD